MKQIKIYLAAIFLLAIIVVACKKNDSDTYSADANQAAENRKLSNSNLVPIDPSDPVEIQALEQFAGYDLTLAHIPLNEAEASIQLAPLMASSRQYFYDLGLSSADLIEEFSSLDNYHIAYIAFQLKAIDLQGGGIPGCDASNKIVRCFV